jgi:hypothetical protein
LGLVGPCRLAATRRYDASLRRARSEGGIPRNRTVHRRLLGGILAIATVVIGLPTIAPAGVDAATPGLTITLDCYASRERTTIRNNRAATVTIRTVGSLYKPCSNEPFSVSRKVSAGKSVTFFTGSGATYSNSFTLTRRNIYNNTISTEGVRVTSSVGTFSKRC